MKLLVVRWLLAPGLGDAPARVLTPWLAVCLLALTGCLRFGYDELPIRVTDGGDSDPPDAAASRDASGQPDAATEADAAVTPDAAAETDAAVTPDAAAMPDGAVALDGAADPDAAAETDAAVGCATTTSDYCLQLPALAADPQLDGLLDCGPGLIDLPPTSWSSKGGVFPSDNHARYAAAWRPGGLYFYVEVDDPVLLPALESHVDPWCGDGVELYVDADGEFNTTPEYDYPGTMQLLATSPALDESTSLAVPARYNTRSSQDRVGDWDTTHHIMVLRDNGYALEAFVVASDLALSSWSLASGDLVGLDIAITVSVADESEMGGCGYDLGQYYLRVSTSPCNNQKCQPHTTIEAFCTATLE
jgi:Carbohydrate family 9 binding domain-like